MATSPDVERLTIVIADDHNLFRKGLINIINSLGDQYAIIGEASNGKQLLELIEKNNTVPDIVILDVNMPEMDGFETLKALNERYDGIKTLVVSMIEKEETVMKMLKSGAKGYLGKDVETNELRDALLAIHQKGYYYTDFLTGRLVHQLQKDSVTKPEVELNQRELEVLKLACTEMTYKEIADKLFLSIKTIDTYRDSLFKKTGAASRVGLVIYAVRNGIVQI